MDIMSEGHQTDAIYTDLSAAFDKINHNITIEKLDRMGFGGNILRWLQSYLADRHIMVKIGENRSRKFHASSGIPQGSHLGPLIFILFSNDVNCILSRPRISLADDMNIYAKVRCSEDALYLQHRMEKIQECW